jgi:O-antigen/teichoic acid export membrane protein
MNRMGDLDAGESVAAKGLTGTVVRGSALAGIGFALSQILTLASYLVLARLVTPTEFGLFTAGLVLVGLARLYTESGMMAALVYRRDRLEEAASTAVVATFLAGVAMGLLMLALAPAIGAFFHDARVTGIAAAAAGLALLRTIAVVPEALLQRRFSFLRRMIVEPGSVLAFGVTGIVLTANGLGVWGLVIAQYASFLVQALLSWGLVSWRPQLRLASYGMWRELISYGRHTIAATTVIRVGEEIPVFLLGRFTGAAALGQLRYGRRIASLPLAMIMAAASYVLFPAFARIATERERFQASVLRALRWMAILAVGGGLIMIPLGKPLTTLAFGSVWAQAGEAVMALGVYTAARGISSLIVEALKAHGRPEVVTRMNVIELVVGTIAMAALLPFGLVGVCVGISIGAIVRAAYALHRAHVVVGLPLTNLLESIRAPLIAALAMLAVLLPLDTLVLHAGERAIVPGLLLVTFEALLGVAIYAGILHVLIPGALAELRGLLTKLWTRKKPRDDEGDQRRQTEIRKRVLARNLFERMSPVEQDAALGSDLAEAVRKGEVELDDLVAAGPGPGRSAPRTGHS